MEGTCKHSACAVGAGAVEANAAFGGDWGAAGRVTLQLRGVLVAVLAAKRTSRLRCCIKFGPEASSGKWMATSSSMAQNSNSLPLLPIGAGEDARSWLPPSLPNQSSNPLSKAKAGPSRSSAAQ